MTRLCNCPKSLPSKLELNSGKQKVIEESCKTCGGRYLVDGIGPIATRMLSTVNPEATNSINPELNWKTVTKGRRSRSSVARNVNGLARLGKRSPKRIGDFSVVDSDKNEESVTGHQIPDKVGNVPLKKRRHLLRSTSPPPHSSLNEDSLLAQPQMPSPHADNFCSDSTKQQLKVAVKPRDRVDDNSISEETDSKLHHPDFSGITLLAVVACIDGISDETTNVKMDPGVGEVSVPERSHPSTSPNHIRCTTFVESENFVQKDVVKEESAECSPVDNSVALNRSSHEDDGGAMESSVASKVHRLHWDLNVTMDAWEQPYDDTVECASSKDVSDHCVKGERLEREDYETSRNFEDNQCDTENHMPLGQTEQNEFELARGPGRACKEIGTMNLDEHPVKSIIDLFTNAENGNQVVSKMSSNLSSAWPESHQVPLMSVNEDMMGTSTGSMSINVKDEMGSNGLPEVLASECSAREICISSVAEVPQKTFELPDDSGSNPFETDHSHSSSKCEELSASCASTYSVVCSPKGQHDRVSAADATVTVALDHAVSKVPTPNYDDHYASDEVENISSIRFKKDDGPHSADPTNYSAKNDSTLEDCHNLDISQVNHSNTVGSKDITEVQAGYDSPYEDGELRVSMSSPWEENEIEDGDNELVDYESDGREVVDFDDADYPDSEVVETGCQGSQGIEKRSLGVREVSALDCSKSGSLRSSSRTDYMKEDNEKIETHGNKLTPESGASNEQFKLNDDSVRRRHTSEHMDVVEIKGSRVEESNSRATRVKLQSQIAGSPLWDVTEGKETGFLQQSRPRFHSRPVRDISPDKSMARRRSTFHLREKNGGDEQWGYWGSRNRFPSSYHETDGRTYTRPRSIIADNTDKFGGINSQDHRESPKFSSKGAHWIPGKRSPYERDDYYHRRMPAARDTISTTRTRGNCSGNYPKGVRNRLPSNYHDSDGHTYTRPRSIIAENADKFGGFSSQDHRESPNHSSKGAHRIPGKRSSYERDDDYSVQRRMPAARDIISTTRTRGSSSGNYPKEVGRGFREEYRDPLPESRNFPSSRIPRYLYRRERSFSPSSGRNVQTSLPRRKSRSRSRTRSPNVWHSQRERNQGLRHHSRSPDFRSEDRLERAGMPLQKPNFTADYPRSVVSPPRGRFSPQRNGRWVDDHEHMDNFPRTRRSPARIFRRGQRFDSVDSSGRLKSDEYSRPTIGPGRFPPFAGTGRECKFEDNSDGRRNDDRVEIIHPARHSDANVSVARFRHDTEDNFDANNSNKEDDVKSTDRRNVPTSSPEDKKPFKV